MAEKQDLMLGQAVLAAGFINKARLDEAVRVQETEESQGRRRPFGRILLDKGYLTPAQLKYILDNQQYLSVRAKDKRFGAIAIRNKLATVEQVNECLRVQEEAYAKTKELPRIGELVVRMGHMTAQQRAAVLQAQEKLAQTPDAPDMTEDEERLSTVQTKPSKPEAPKQIPGAAAPRVAKGIPPLQAPPAPEQKNTVRCAHCGAVNRIKPAPHARIVKCGKCHGPIHVSAAPGEPDGFGQRTVQSTKPAEVPDFDPTTPTLLGVVLFLTVFLPLAIAPVFSLSGGGAQPKTIFVWDLLEQSSMLSAETMTLWFACPVAGILFLLYARRPAAERSVLLLLATVAPMVMLLVIIGEGAANTNPGRSSFVEQALMLLHVTAVLVMMGSARIRGEWPKDMTARVVLAVAGGICILSYAGILGKAVMTAASHEVPAKPGATIGAAPIILALIPAPMALMTLLSAGFPEPHALIVWGVRLLGVLWFVVLSATMFAAAPVNVVSVGNGLRIVVGLASIVVASGQMLELNIIERLTRMRAAQASA